MILLLLLALVLLALAVLARDVRTDDRFDRPPPPSRLS
jgi:hypothetical protein